MYILNKHTDKWNIKYYNNTATIIIILKMIIQKAKTDPCLSFCNMKKILFSAETKAWSWHIFIIYYLKFFSNISQLITFLKNTSESRTVYFELACKVKLPFSSGGKIFKIPQRTTCHCCCCCTPVIILTCKHVKTLLTADLSLTFWLSALLQTSFSFDVRLISTLTESTNTLTAFQHSRRNCFCLPRASVTSRLHLLRRESASASHRLVNLHT